MIIYTNKTIMGELCYWCKRDKIYNLIEKWEILELKNQNWKRVWYIQKKELIKYTMNLLNK